ncbi:MAG TPA: hypothetical protein VF867_20050 [Arthrobacter sp.]
MSADLAAAIGAPRLRYDRVEAAYDGMSPANRASFRRIIRDETYSHAQVASAMREIGYDVDRKQVQAYREKLAIGRVALDE